MVKMRMGEEYGIDDNRLRQAQVARAGTGIDQDVVVHHVASGASFAGDAAVTTYGGDTHSALPFHLDIRRNDILSASFPH